MKFQKDPSIRVTYCPLCGTSRDNPCVSTNRFGVYKYYTGNVRSHMARLKRALGQPLITVKEKKLVKAEIKKRKK